MNLKKVIPAARGDKPADLLIKNARIINVFSGEVVKDSVAVAEGYVVGFGDYAARQTIDLGGRFLAPGFIDPHVHIESAMTSPSEFARAVVVRGTTTVVADPHEIANVLGIRGIDYMLQSSQDQPLRIFFTLPSCVPATNMETAGARLEADDLSTFWQDERVVALGEMMNFPGVIESQPAVLQKIEDARTRGRRVEGHAPRLTGHSLHAYLSAGISSDHECTTAGEAREKLMAGMHIMIRQGTGARNLAALLPIINARSSRRLMWCTDDRHPHDLLQEGHIDSILREAIRSGIDPITAIQMATLNPAEYFRLSDAGAIGPGRRADLVVLSSLQKPHVEAVYFEGRLVAQHGAMLPDIPKPVSVSVPPSIRVKVEWLDFSIPAAGERVRVINVVPNQIVTRQSIEDAPVSQNRIVSDPSRDILKIAVVERHKGSGNIGNALVKGLGLQKGALASSVAHDSHNIIVTGTTDADMKAAIHAVVQMGGGLCAVCGGNVRARLPLPIAGLMSEDPVASVKDQLDRLLKVARELGATLPDPFMTLSFLALPVIPELKITDKGLVDVLKFQIVSLFV
jgi:adenine deaminase